MSLGETVPAQRRRAWHAAVTLHLTLLILALPLARHWVVFPRPPFDIYYEFTSIVLYASDVVVVLFLLTTVLWVLLDRPSVQWGPAAVTVPLALLPLLAWVSVPGAGDPVLAAYTAGRLFVLLALYLAIATLRPAARTVRLGLAAGVILQSAVAAAQFTTRDDLGWQRLGEIALSPIPGEGSILKVGGHVWLRGYGLTPHPNILGGILAVMLLALVVSYLRGSGLQQLGWLAILAAGGLGLVVSFSRAAWLGGVVGGSVLLYGVLGARRWRQRYGRAIAVLVAIATVLVGSFALARPEPFLARLGQAASYEEARSLDERAVLLDKSLELIQEDPLAGIGAGNFSLAVAPLLENAPFTAPQPVHNMPLLLASELGLAGGAVWVWLMLAPPLLAWRRWRTGRLSLWALGLTAGLVALAVTDLFDFYSWEWTQGRLLRWTFLGLWAGTASD